MKPADGDRREFTKRDRRFQQQGDAARSQLSPFANAKDDDATSGMYSWYTRGVRASSGVELGCLFFERNGQSTTRRFPGDRKP
jgi:hypothetical protein